MSERKSDGKKRLRKQPRMRRVYSATSTPLPGLSMPKTARKRKQRNSRQRISRPISGAKSLLLNTRWLSVIVIGLAAYALFIIGGDDRFYINYIPVEGASTININEIVAESGLAGRHVFAADPQAAAEEISTVSGVVTATVSLHWPNDVMIRVREKPPMATWQEGEQSYWIDEDGHLTEARAETIGLLTIISEVPARTNEELAEQINTVLGIKDEEEEAADGETAAAVEEGDEEAMQVEDEVDSQAAFVPQPVLQGALQLRELRPNIDKLYYDASDGLGYQDGRGWTAYFGAGRNMHQKLVVYETLVAELLARGETPAYISVANQYKPYYRLVP